MAAVLEPGPLGPKYKVETDQSPRLQSLRGDKMFLFFFLFDFFAAYSLELFVNGSSVGVQSNVLPHNWVSPLSVLSLTVYQRLFEPPSLSKIDFEMT